MKIGTMVMLNIPSSFSKSSDCPDNGAIGEVMEPNNACKAEMAVGEVAVHFPRNPSASTSKLWAIPTSHLIPLSDPDMDMTEDEHEPVEENVN